MMERSLKAISTSEPNLGGTGTDSYDALNEDLAAVWVLVCAFLVFFMQSGFALLESGAVRSKNTKNILLKNVIDACMAAIAWWAVGHAFAFGGDCDGNPFIGSTDFFLSKSSNRSSDYFAFWVFNYAFSATSSTIVSGAVSERTQFRSYVLYTLALTSFIYPVVAHWVWSPPGWLSAGDASCGNPDPVFSGTNGVIDFAGSGVVHMVGGGAALVGAMTVGPRIGRFSSGHVVLFEHSNFTQIVLGTLILWFGWYGFNAGSTGCVVGAGCISIAGRAAANTTISIAAGGMTCLALTIFLGAPGDVMPLLNGILGGAVSITAPCAVVEPYAAGVIGVIGACVYMASSKLLLRLRIDDPLDASPVHFFCGIWGVFSAGLFAREQYVQDVYGYANGYGIFYGSSAKQLGIQVLGIVVIAVWTMTLAAIIFLSLKYLGWLRVDKDSELQGLDIAESIGHGQLFAGLLGRCFVKQNVANEDKDIEVYAYTSREGHR